jgi:hypothetical protein
MEETCWNYRPAARRNGLVVVFLIGGFGEYLVEHPELMIEHVRLAQGTGDIAEIHLQELY